MTDPDPASSPGPPPKGGRGLMGLFHRFRKAPEEPAVAVSQVVTEATGELVSQARAFQDLRVDDVMTRNLVLAKDTEDLDEALRRMRRAGVRRVPVVDTNGALRGLLSFDDILEHVEEQVGALTRLIGREREREVGARGRVARWEGGVDVALGSYRGDRK